MLLANCLQCEPLIPKHKEVESTEKSQKQDGYQNFPVKIGETLIFVNKQCMNLAAIIFFTKQDFLLECFSFTDF